jgi:hypothetical protein
MNEIKKAQTNVWAKKLAQGLSRALINHYLAIKIKTKINYVLTP